MNAILKNILPSFFILFAVLLTTQSFGQKYFTKTGSIYFTAGSSLEKIEATNKAANCVFDGATNKIEWGVLIKGFQFEKALMQEHFNENYLESTKFPKATFKGLVSGFDLKKSGVQNVKVAGDLTIHGVTKAVTTDGTMNVKDGKIDVLANFSAALADYNIGIPSVVKEQISKVVKIKVSASLAALNK